MRRRALLVLAWVRAVSLSDDVDGLRSCAGLDGGPNGVTGVICRHSQCKMSSITDGAEQHLPVGREIHDARTITTDGLAADDDQCWSCGYDYDVNRWTN